MGLNEDILNKETQAELNKPFARMYNWTHSQGLLAYGNQHLGTLAGIIVPQLKNKINGFNSYYDLLASNAPAEISKAFKGASNDFETNFQALTDKEKALTLNYILSNERILRALFVPQLQNQRDNTKVYHEIFQAVIRNINALNLPSQMEKAAMHVYFLNKLATANIIDSTTAMYTKYGYIALAHMGTISRNDPIEKLVTGVLNSLNIDTNRIDQTEFHKFLTDNIRNNTLIVTNTNNWIDPGSLANYPHNANFIRNNWGKILYAVTLARTSPITS